MEHAKYTKALYSCFNGLDAHTVSMKVEDLIKISYVATRRQDDEAGAVQRLLKQERVDSICEFIKKGNTFVNTFILNWTNSSEPIIFNNDELSLPLKERSAQLLDGQHRVEGFKKASETMPNVKDLKVLVTIFVNLSTDKAAEIFLNINSEQKPVNKNLIYDLFTEINHDENFCITIGHDIATIMNENKDSPYFSKIRFPNLQGAIDLSTVINAIKKEVDKDGTFMKYGIKDKVKQTAIILDFFKAIESFYSNLWNDVSKNPFMQNAGFNGAFECLMEYILPECYSLKKYDLDTFKSLLNLDVNSLKTRKHFTKFEGRTARKMIKDYLAENLLNKRLSGD